jgi:bis(5'-nucleosyl)-tetraphosphatase (symmetrical)
MATYAIGDLQGCFYTFQSLLDKLSFNTSTDELWLVGDILNRGKNSLEVVDWCYENQQHIKLVLGNHDLHFLSIAFALKNSSRKDTLSKILSISKLSSYLDWFLSIPLLHSNKNYIMTHAGLLPSWSKEEAMSLSCAFSDALRNNPEYVLKSMYGNYPNQWSDSLPEDDRYRFTVNVMTRMRCLNNKEQLDLKYKGNLSDIPDNIYPWFVLDTKRDGNELLITGHWSAIGFHKHRLGFALDSGCVWGEHLTALCLETKNIYTEPADLRDLA